MTIVRVTVQGETFTVEVVDPQARPVVALVDGERFEIWPEAEPPALEASGAPDRRSEAFAASPSAGAASDGQMLRPAGRALSPSAGAASDGQMLRPAGRAANSPAPASAQPRLAHSSNGQSASAQAVLAPLPGVVAGISVQPGDVVVAGQELLAIEAMKMKNVIRAVRAGSIARVHVAPGQSVQHKQVLVEYA